MITLKTLEQATEQEVFDQVAAHLLKQKNKSMFGGEFCAYLNDNGLQCAAGCLIAEDEYVRSMEGNDWHDMVMMGFVPSKHESLIGELQNIHDNYMPETWRELLWDLALENNLSTIVLENDQQENE